MQIRSFTDIFQALFAYTPNSSKVSLPSWRIEPRRHAGGNSCTIAFVSEAIWTHPGKSGLRDYASSCRRQVPRCFRGNCRIRLHCTATLIAGGDGRARLRTLAGVATASAELYTPATGTWMPTGSMNTARIDATATLLPSGQVLVAGGYNLTELGIEASWRSPVAFHTLEATSAAEETHSTQEER